MDHPVIQVRPETQVRQVLAVQMAELAAREPLVPQAYLDLVLQDYLDQQELLALPDILVLLVI